MSRMWSGEELRITTTFRIRKRGGKVSKASVKQSEVKKLLMKDEVFKEEESEKR